MNTHDKRVSALEYPSSACASVSENWLYTGSKDRKIYLNDLHLRNPVVSHYTAHKG